MPLANLPTVLFVSGAKGYKSIGEFVTAAKAKPGSMSYGSGGVGNATHLNAERFMLSAGFQAVHVPFKGSPEALTEVLAQRIDFSFSTLLPGLQLLQDGKLKALAVSSSRRATALPDVPTTTEAGFPIPTTTSGPRVMVPRKTDRAIVDILYRQTTEALQLPDVQARIRALGADPMAMTSTEFDKLIADEVNQQRAREGGGHQGQLKSMKTRVKGRWVVGHHNGRHALIKDGEVVYENDSIIFVGRGFAGDVDEEIDGTGMLVAPGFIDTHVHAGYRAQKRMITDVGRPDYFGQPFLEFDVARARAAVGGDARFFSDEDKRLHASDPWALFTAVELIRNGVTTFVEMGAPVHMQEALAAAVERIGTRAYLGAGYDLGGWVGGPEGRLTRVVDEAAGAQVFAEFDRVLAAHRRQGRRASEGHPGAQAGRDLLGRAAAPDGGARKAAPVPGLHPCRLQRARVL